MRGLRHAGFTVDDVAALECTYAPQSWGFAAAFGERIDRHWADQAAKRPHLFNGRVLMQTRGGVEQRSDGRPVFRAAYAEVEFKAFLAWRDFGHPVRGFRNGFGMAALQSADGAFILGEMGGHTANAGRVYFPSGTPDRSDIAGASVDIGGSIARELGEETGLDPATLAIETGFRVLHDDLRVCFMQRMRAAEDAATLVARIAASLAAQPMPELARMHIVRTAADITPAMPAVVAAYLALAFGAEPQA